MKFNILSEVIYIDEHASKIYTYVEEVNQEDQTYIIHHNNLTVTEEQLSENPQSDFRNPPKEVKEAMEIYAIDFNIAMIVSRLQTDIEDKEVSIERLGTDIIIAYTPINQEQFDNKTKIKTKLLTLINTYQFNFLRKIGLHVTIFLVFPYTSQEPLKTITI